MHAFLNGNRGQEGSVMVIVMIVLALLTVIGISATNMSNTEMKIAGNDKDYKIAFYHAESGDYALTKWVTRILDDEEIPQDIEGAGDGPAGKNRFRYLDSDPTDLWDEAMRYDDAYDDAKDFEFTMTSGVEDEDEGISRSSTSTVTVDLDRRKSQQAIGGGAEFESGASGIGERAAIEIPFWFASEAVTETGTRKAIWVKYIKLLGVPGGL